MKKLNAFVEQNCPHWDKILFFSILFYFIVRLCFFATSITPSIPPDELERVELIALYSRYSGFILEDSAATYHLGMVGRAPTFYFWLMGRLTKLNLLKIPPLFFLRFINIMFSITSVFIAYKLFHLLSKDKWVNLLGVVVLTNIPMYSFLSAFVSYDNLANLFSVISFYFLFKYLKKHKVKHLHIAIISSLLGTLTKHSFLPLLLIFAFIYFFDSFKNRKGILSLNNFHFGKLTLTNFIPFLLITLLVFLNVNLYGRNFLYYRAAVPSCAQVLTQNQCMQHKNYRIYAELRNIARAIPKENFLKPHDYFFYWKIVLERGIFGIFGHKLLFRTSTELLPYNILILLFLIFLIRRFDRKEYFINYCIFSVATYFLILFYFVNYTIYRSTGFIEAALQGRYIFPVIYPLVFLFSYFLLKGVNKKAKILFSLIVCSIFIWGDLPYFLKHADKAWYISKNTPSVTPLFCADHKTCRSSQ